MDKDFLLSIVIPVYNEQNNVKPFLDELQKALKEYKHEIIFVDDGSTDETVKNIKKYCEKDKNIKLLSFYRNFGHQMALTAGYREAKGSCVLTIDADLQDPPEIIQEMVKKWQEGAKIVYAKREQRDVDSVFKRLTASFFYNLINFLSESPVIKEVGDFRLLDREVVDFLNNLPEESRFLRGLVSWGGYPAEVVNFKRQKRHTGETHYTFSKMLNFALDGITSFSIKPLRLAIYLGFLTSGFSILVIFYKVIQHFIFGSGDWLPGWASQFFATVFLGGVQLITIGIIGEYISKIYKEVQKRPQYLIKEKINL